MIIDLCSFNLYKVYMLWRVHAAELYLSCLASNGFHEQLLPFHERMLPHDV